MLGVMVLRLEIFRTKVGGFEDEAASTSLLLLADLLYASDGFTLFI